MSDGGIQWYYQLGCQQEYEQWLDSQEEQKEYQQWLESLEYLTHADQGTTSLG